MLSFISPTTHTHSHTWGHTFLNGLLKRDYSGLGKVEREVNMDGYMINTYGNATAELSHVYNAFSLGVNMCICVLDLDFSHQI